MRLKMLQRRKYLGLSQTQAAQEIGMLQANYSHIERGRHEPSLAQMKAIAAMLRVYPDISFFEDTKANKTTAKERR
ncbi:MAG: hypothetical protein DDT19_01091 [Syntrophomonadaceae bacterium]|nr:hypothetical protein [Bacillota bacterium]